MSSTVTSNRRYDWLNMAPDRLLPFQNRQFMTLLRSRGLHVIKFSSFSIHLISKIIEEKKYQNSSFFNYQTIKVDTICSIPLILSIFIPVLRVVFIPSFLQIWFSRELMNESFNFMQRKSNNNHSILFYKVVQLIMTFSCVVITCMGFVNHLERAGKASGSKSDH